MKFSIPLKDYNISIFRKDFIAALTVVVLIIPQGMAYAVLTGVPPIYGLYAFLVPLFIYPLFGSSPFLSVGPVAIVSILVATGLCHFAEPMSTEYIQLAILVSLIAGILQFGLYIMRAGFLVNFLSHPVLAGFTSGAAVIIIISQLKHALGVSLARQSNIFYSLKDLLLKIPELNIITLVFFLSTLIGILFFKRIKQSFPSYLFFILITSLLIYYLGLDKDVHIIGSVPSGLPQFTIPSVTNLDTIISLLPLAILVGFVSFVESLSIAKSLAARNGNMAVDPNKELLGLGLAKIGGAFFQAFPNTGSFSRSAINESVGAKTGISSILAAGLVGISLLFFTSLFYYIAYSVLAAIIVSAVLKLIDYKEALHLFKSDRGDFWVFMLTFTFTLIFGVQYGILGGICVSLFLILKRASQPHVAILGKIDNSGIYRNINRFDEAETDDEVLIIRYDEDIFFANAEHFYSTVMDEIKKQSAIKYIILDMSSVSNIDSTGIKQFKILIQNIQAGHVQIHISGPKGPLRDRLKQEGIIELIGKENHHQSIEKSMQSINKPTLNVIN